MKIQCAIFSTGLICCAACAEIKISVVGDGTGYDVLGTADNEAAAYRSTGIPKSFDVDGDNVYGTEGLLMFGNGEGERNLLRFPTYTRVGMPWVAFSPGADFRNVAQAVERQGPMDDPTRPIKATVPDWGSVGSMVTTDGGCGAEREIMRFTILPGAPPRFRLGLVGGTQDQKDGRWDPTSYTLSAGTVAATVNELENNGNSYANFVFFDIDLNGATNTTTFIISGTQRLARQGASIAGVTIDLPPGSASTYIPITVEQATALLRTEKVVEGKPERDRLVEAAGPSSTPEEKIARIFKGYRQNTARMAAIDEELSTLPQPYMREPTGTGGFLSHEQESSTSEVVLIFSWDKPAELDAVALFPLRLFMDEIYGENLYWPGSITIQATVDDRTATIARCINAQPLIPQSLPNLIGFAPVRTRTLTIRCTDLPEHPYEKWHAAGFAEICIFSGADNVAPRAVVKTSSTRQGYHVLAQEFLTDAQSPLGLPQLSCHSKINAFVKRHGFKQKNIPGTYVLTCKYTGDILIDAVRIDPAIQHSYGQSFPVRFTVDLLDGQGQVVQSDNTYKTFPLRTPGLNPHFCYFPETMAQAVRLTVYEASQPVPEAIPAIALSEITALHKGEEPARATAFEEQYNTKTLSLAQGEPLDTETKLMLASANDGLTHSGQVLPLRKWIEGLVRRQQLMEEQLTLQIAQKKNLEEIGKTLIYGSLALVLFAVGSAFYLIVRNRIRMRKELRLARVKMASDLHDDVGSNLGAIVLHVEKLQETQAGQADCDRLLAILRLTRESVFGLREVLRTTAPEVGRAQDILAHMRELAGLHLGKTSFTFKADPSVNDLLQDDTGLCKGLLLFYKEALHNAKTHSQCSHVDISFRREREALILDIKDNGTGIDEQTLKKKHTLRTIKQRAHWLHADLKIESSPGAGTELTLSIPKK